ncbi:serine hydrolase domain-containing protein [Streptomyces vinaceus]|uniref:serine hydrolase domain-containing protein n=1 Tax=Streptomyces vinaceus TaxID=1960 RepID=UPI0035E0ED82
MKTPSINVQAITELLAQAVQDKVCPGAVWAIGDAEGTRAAGHAGLLDPDQHEHPMAQDTIFDLASITKIIATWSTVGALWEEGLLNLQRPLETFWDEVRGHPVGGLTPHHLLTHTSGLPLHANLEALYGTDRHAIRAGVLREPLRRPPGEEVEYTDRAAIILGYLCEYLTGEPLERLARNRTWSPLRMDRTHYGPLPPDLVKYCAPTEVDPDTRVPLKGTVHDFSSRLHGGVCGNAGVFSDRDDLARFLRYLLNQQSSPTPAGFGRKWVEESLRIQTGDLNPGRGLFWHPSPVSGPPVYAHLGFTGTAVWVSPARNRWALLLTNKLYYTRERELIEQLRVAFRRLAFSLSASAGCHLYAPPHDLSATEAGPGREPT